MIKKIVLFALVLIGLQACKSDAKKEAPSLMKEVMDVHDAVMPKMGTIGKLVKLLNQQKDSLLEAAPTAEIDLKIVALSTGVDSLQKAHKKMMTWMKDFGGNFTADEILKGKALNAEKKSILEQEAIKVKEMEAAIIGSIQYAEQVSIQ
ncbi:hypothetical protein N8Z58_03790 [Flavobacteriaceae bacterium]|nr:hypothetical protein [Flavobacteriaceae bacterium]